MTEVRTYLAGPMRGYADFNFPAFIEGAKKLRERGYDVHSPADHEVKLGYDARGHNGDLDKFSKATGFDLRRALKEDLEQVCSADMVVVLPGWENSKGARAEVATAAALSLPVVPLDLALLSCPPHRKHHLIIDLVSMPFRDMQAITMVDQWLDAGASDRYQQEPLAQDWARISKAAEGAGEAISAFIGCTGQNPRKGVKGSMRNVLDELADTAFSAIFAIQHFTKDAEGTVDILDMALEKAVARVNRSNE